MIRSILSKANKSFNSPPSSSILLRYQHTELRLSLKLLLVVLNHSSSSSAFDGCVLHTLSPAAVIKWVVLHRSSSDRQSLLSERIMIFNNVGAISDPWGMPMSILKDQEYTCFLLWLQYLYLSETIVCIHKCDLSILFVSVCTEALHAVSDHMLS